MAKQRFIAYVAFEDGAIRTENVIDDFGEFIGMEVYRDAAEATKRHKDVREVEITIGKRVKQTKVTPAKVSVEEIERDLGHEIR